MPGFDGPRDRAGPLGPGGEPRRQATRARRVVRMLNSEFNEFAGDPEPRPLPGAAARRDRLDQRARLQQHQQRRLPLRLRFDPAGLRGGLRRALRGARLGRRPARREALPDRRHDHRGRLAAVRDAGQVRLGHTWATSSATRGASPTTTTSPATCASSTSTRGSARRSNLDHIKRHYYMTHPQINPTRVVPMGPVLDLDSPPGREHL